MEEIIDKYIRKLLKVEGEHIQMLYGDWYALNYDIREIFGVEDFKLLEWMDEHFPEYHHVTWPNGNEYYFIGMNSITKRRFYGRRKK